MRERNFPRHKFIFSAGENYYLFWPPQKVSKSVEIFTHHFCAVPHPVWPCGGSLTIGQVHISSIQFIVHTPRLNAVANENVWHFELKSKPQQLFSVLFCATPCDMSAAVNAIPFSTRTVPPMARRHLCCVADGQIVHYIQVNFTDFTPTLCAREQCATAMAAHMGVLAVRSCLNVTLEKVINERMTFNRQGARSRRSITV